MSRPKPNIILEHVNNDNYKSDQVVSFSNTGHAHNLAKKLNDMFSSEEFAVFKLTDGEVVIEE